MAKEAQDPLQHWRFSTPALALDGMLGMAFVYLAADYYGRGRWGMMALMGVAGLVCLGDMAAKVRRRLAH